jgi:hypothetical protein
LKKRYYEKEKIAIGGVILFSEAWGQSGATARCRRHPFFYVYFFRALFGGLRHLPSLFRHAASQLVGVKPHSNKKFSREINGAASGLD